MCTIQSLCVNHEHTFHHAAIQYGDLSKEVFFNKLHGRRLWCMKKKIFFFFRLVINESLVTSLTCNILLLMVQNHKSAKLEK